MDQLLFWLVPAASVLALCFAWYFHRQMMKESEELLKWLRLQLLCAKAPCPISVSNIRLWDGCFWDW